MSCKRTARRPPKRVRVTIDSLAFGGDGVGREPAGRVVFVSGTAPGDDVEGRVIEEKKGFLRVLGDKVWAPSATRVEPPCPRFGAVGVTPHGAPVVAGPRADVDEEDVDVACGGCQWQHVAIAAQLAAKEEIVRRALRKACPPGLLEPIRAPTAPYGWRRRARLRWRRSAIGYAARRSHRLIDVPECAQLTPVLERALAAIRAGLAAKLGASGELELIAGERGAVHVALAGRGAPGLAGAAAELLGRAGIAGIHLSGEDGEAPVSLGEGEIDLGDDPSAPFWARADVFAQASAAGNATLRDLVTVAAREAADRLGRPPRVLELHAGSANFTRDLAAIAVSVVAVEDAARASFDLIVVDPPRVGLEDGLAAALARVAAMGSRLIYVSCDPPTLARDLSALPAFTVVRAAPVDLMPQTYHVETVVVLDRTASA